MYGKTYICDHPIYNNCTLFQIKEKGLAVIQQRFDPVRKVTWWGAIDWWLADPLYLNSGFESYFNEKAGTSVNGLYPTVTIRSIMWSLKMNPLPKEPWETVFDRRVI